MSTADDLPRDTDEIGESQSKSQTELFCEEERSNAEEIEEENSKAEELRPDVDIVESDSANNEKLPLKGKEDLPIKPSISEMEVDKFELVNEITSEDIERKSSYSGMEVDKPEEKAFKEATDFTKKDISPSERHAEMMIIKYIDVDSLDEFFKKMEEAKQKKKGKEMLNKRKQPKKEKIGKENQTAVHSIKKKKRKSKDNNPNKEKQTKEKLEKKEKSLGNKYKDKKAKERVKKVPSHAKENNGLKNSSAVPPLTEKEEESNKIPQTMIPEKEVLPEVQGTDKCANGVQCESKTSKNAKEVTVDTEFFNRKNAGVNFISENEEKEKKMKNATEKKTKENNFNMKDVKEKEPKGNLINKVKEEKSKERKEKKTIEIKPKKMKSLKEKKQKEEDQTTARQNSENGERSEDTKKENLPKLVKPTLPSVSVDEVLNNKNTQEKPLPKLKKSSFKAPTRTDGIKKITPSFSASKKKSIGGKRPIKCVEELEISTEPPAKKKLVAEDLGEMCEVDLNAMLVRDEKSSEKVSILQDSPEF